MEKLWGVFMQGFIAAIFGLTAYILLCIIFRSGELFHFFKMLSFRFKK